MKKTLFFLLLIILIGGSAYYFTPSKDLKILSKRDFPWTAKNTAAPGAVLGVSIDDVPGAAGAKDVFDSLAKVVLNPKQTIEDITTNVKQGILEQVANVLDVVTSSGSKDKGVDNSARIVATAFDVCSAHHKNELVSYFVEFAPSAANAVYSVDWGDGNVSRNDPATKERKILISHTYAKEGSYTIKFFVAGSNAAFDQRIICIQ